MLCMNARDNSAYRFATRGGCIKGKQYKHLQLKTKYVFVLKTI